MREKFFNVGGKYFLQQVSNVEEPLAKGVYTLQDDPRSGFYLEKTHDGFNLNHKIYGKETSFVERVTKTFDNTTGNLGILLSGVKGTGKTVTSKLIANSFLTQDIPVIIIPQAYNNVQDFISKIPQSVVLFFDEFEKMYPADYNNSADILTVMEGVRDNGQRRVFLLTTNSLRINDNLIERPGRIRYHKKYTDLTLDVITEIVDDLLENKELKESTIDFISQLKTITVDIVRSVVNEVNIHNEDPKEFGSYFNIKTEENKFDIIQIKEDGAEIPYLRDINLIISESNDVLIRGLKYGKIVAELDNNKYIYDPEDRDDDDNPIKPFMIKIESRSNIHKSFISIPTKMVF